MISWFDKNGVEIKSGDILRNNWNDPPELPIYEDEDGVLYLGDMDTPFENKYQFDVFWEIVGKENN
jgi:hypothetical protein